MTKINLTDTDGVRALFPRSRFVRDVYLFLYQLEMNGYPPGQTYAVKWKALASKGTIQKPDECELVVLTDERDLGLLAGLALAYARYKSDSIEAVTVHRMSLFFYSDEDEEEEDEEEPATSMSEGPDSDSDWDSDDSVRARDGSAGQRARESSLSPSAKRRRRPPTAFHGDVYSRPGGRYAFKENPDLARERQLRKKLLSSST